MTDVESTDGDARQSPAMFMPGSRSRQILKTVAAKHKLRVSDIIGRCRQHDHIAARRDAVEAMNAIGLTQTSIARAMQRDRTTIAEYTSPRRRQLKKDYRRVAMAGEKWITTTKKWSDEMDLTLVSLLESGLSYSLIADAMQMTHGAVLGRVSRLGLRGSERRTPSVIKKRYVVPLAAKVAVFCSPSLRARIKEVASINSASLSEYIRGAVVQRMKSEGFDPELAS